MSHMETHHIVPVICIRNMHKSFQNSNRTFKALSDVCLDILPGQMVGLIGASGSGKSTMLRHLAGLTTADRTANSVKVLGRNVQSDGVIDRDIRTTRANVGFIFQQFNIVNRLTVLSNVLAGSLGRIPSWRGTAGWFTNAERVQALESLARVDMKNFAQQRASTLSGGQQQRVAIARALMQGAEVILADEPIASLDPVSARNVMEILARINREDRKTVVVSLHQVDFAFRYCERIVALKRGIVVFDGPSAGITSEMLHDIYGEKFDETCVEKDAFAAPQDIRFPLRGNGRRVPASAGALVS